MQGMETDAIGVSCIVDADVQVQCMACQTNLRVSAETTDRLTEAG